MKTNCSEDDRSDNGWGISPLGFCADYRDTDFLYGDYYTKKYSWLRFVVHRCDPEEIIYIDGIPRKKKCASKTEQDKFFRENIFVFSVKSQKADLTEETNVLKDVNTEIYYSTKVSD